MFLFGRFFLFFLPFKHQKSTENLVVSLSDNVYEGIADIETDIEIVEKSVSDLNVSMSVAPYMKVTEMESLFVRLTNTISEKCTKREQTKSQKYSPNVARSDIIVTLKLIEKRGALHEKETKQNGALLIQLAATLEKACLGADMQDVKEDVKSFLSIATEMKTVKKIKNWKKISVINFYYIFFADVDWCCP